MATFDKITLMFIDRKQNLHSFEMIKREEMDGNSFDAEIPEDNLIVGIIANSRPIFDGELENFPISDYEKHLFRCNNVTFRVPAHYFRLANTNIHFYFTR